MMDPSTYQTKLYETREVLDSLAAKQISDPNEKIIYRKDGSYISAERASFWERNFGTTSLANYAKKACAVYQNTQFTESHTAAIEKTRAMQQSGSCANYDSYQDFKSDYVKFDNECVELLRNDIARITQLKDRVSREIIHINQAIEAFGIFKIFVLFFYVGSLSRLLEAYDATDDVLESITLQGRVMKIEKPSEPHILLTDASINTLLDNLDLTDRVAAVPDARHFLNVNGNNVVQNVSQDFSHFLRTDHPIILFNQNNKVRSRENLAREVERELRAIFGNDNPPEDAIYAVESKVLNYIKLEVKNFNNAVEHFLKTRYPQKYFFLEEKIQARLQMSIPITADELVNYCERLNALYVVTYNPPGLVDRMLAPLDAALEFLGVAEEDPEENVYLNALVASGLNKTLFRSDLEDLNKYLKKTAVTDSTFCLLVNPDGSIPRELLHAIIYNYIVAKGGSVRPEVSNSLYSPEGIAKALVSAFPDRDRALMRISDVEAIDLLGNLGYDEPIISDDLRTKIAEFLADDPSISSLYYASLQGKDMKDTKSRHAKFNLSLFNFLREHTRKENKLALEEALVEFFDQTAIETIPCSPNDFKRLLDIAEKAPPSPFQGFMQFITRIEREFDPLRS